MESKRLEFETIFVKTDVTALKIIQNDYLLVGIGNTLNLYEISTERFVTSTKIFIGQKIHGLVPSNGENKIAVYGGKEIRICTLNIDKNVTISTNEHFQSDDWILTLIWIKSDTEFALLTAHNIVQIWNVESKTLKASFKCDEKCILYSGLLKEWNDNIVVFAGTVFSQIVLWNTNSTKVQNRLIGHKGVIFSISYDEVKNTIVTTSDDRSVMIWSIERKGITDWSDLHISLKITLFGHTARVMRNEIVGNYIVSIGEDSVMCTWDFDGNLLNKRRIHRDGCLWSLDCDLNRNIVITGGGDSGVMIHRLVSNLNNLDAHIKSLEFPGIAKCVAVTARNHIVCLTECGKLIYHTDDEELDVRCWDEIKPCSMFVSICRQFVALIDVNGFLVVLAETCKFEPKLVQCVNQRICNGRIFSFNWLHDRKFCTCDKSGIVTVWGSRADHCNKLNEYYLPSCKERWITAAMTISDDAFLVGDRCGSIHLYNKQSAHPVQTLTKVHGRLGVNSVKLSGSKVTTLGRDGTVKVFKIINDDGRIELKYLHCTKLPFNWVDQFVGKDGTVVCGFRETDLVIWDVEDNQHLAEINCGGGHRSWDVVKKWKRINGDNVCHFQFTYVKNCQVNTVDINMGDLSRCIIRGFHVKEINSLVSLKRGNGDNYTFVSAGEDTTLIFNRCRINGDGIDFENQFKITKHLSSVRCLYVHVENERSVMFSAGGRAQICAWELNSSDGGGFECAEIASHLVKGTDYERKGNVSWRDKKVDADAETRFMSLACLSSYFFANIESNDGIVLFSGCSDGFLRVYSIKTSFELIGCYSFNSKCILKVHAIVFEARPILFTASVDGTLSIWDFKCPVDDLKPVKSMKLHKAGINSFDLCRIGEDKFILATGSDDNDMQLNVISLTVECDELIVSQVCKWSCDKYHCSQITGVKLLSGEYILSASIDQRVTILQLDYDKNSPLNIDCKFVGQYHASVSDIQGMTVLNHDRNEVLICVYGKGIELIRIKLPC